MMILIHPNLQSKWFSLQWNELRTQLECQI
jgi:hypothetical protein